MEAILGERSPRIEIDGRPVTASTRIVAAGGYVLTFTTLLPDLGIDLNSTYTGHPRAERTVITELFLCPQRGPLLYTRDVDPTELPVLHGRSNCLYDHLLRMNELLGSLGFRVAIDGLDGALEALRPKRSPAS